MCPKVVTLFFLSRRAEGKTFLKVCLQVVTLFFLSRRAEGKTFLKVSTQVITLFSNLFFLSPACIYAVRPLCFIYLKGKMTIQDTPLSSQKEPDFKFWLSSDAISDQLFFHRFFQFFRKLEKRKPRRAKKSPRDARKRAFWTHENQNFGRTILHFRGAKSARPLGRCVQKSLSRMRPNSVFIVVSYI